MWQTKPQPETLPLKASLKYHKSESHPFQLEKQNTDEYIEFFSLNPTNHNSWNTSIYRFFFLH